MCFMPVLPFLYVYTVILAVMLKSAILMPKNSMWPTRLPLNKNYYRKYYLGHSVLVSVTLKNDAIGSEKPNANALRLGDSVPISQ